MYSPVDVVKLEKLVKECWYDWTDAERLTAKTAILKVKGEGFVTLSRDLPGLIEKNAA